MDDVNGDAILGSLAFRFGVVGAQITRVFGERIEELGLTHKQVGVLAVVDSGRARSQREVAQALGIAPSLVVTLVDGLVDAGAVTRIRDRRDRRLHVLRTTDAGRALLARSVDKVRELDAALHTLFAPAGADALATALGACIGGDGLPVPLDEALRGPGR